MAKHLEEATAPIETITRDADWICDVLDEVVRLAAEEKDVPSFLKQQGVTQIELIKWRRQRPELEKLRTRKSMPLPPSDTTASSPISDSDSESDAEPEDQSIAKKKYTQDEQRAIAKEVIEIRQTGRRGDFAAYCANRGIERWQANHFARKFKEEFGDGSDVAHLKETTPEEKLRAIERRAAQIEELARGLLHEESVMHGARGVRMGVEVNRKLMGVALTTIDPHQNGQPKATAEDVVVKNAAEPPAPTTVAGTPMQKTEPPKEQPSSARDVRYTPGPAKAARPTDPETVTDPDQQRQLRVIQWAREQDISDGSASFKQVAEAIAVSFKKLNQQAYGVWKAQLARVDRDWEVLQRVIGNVMVEYFTTTFNPTSKNVDRNKVREDLREFLTRKNGPIKDKIWRINQGLSL